MGKASSVKGAKAERDIAALLTELVGRLVRRRIGAGRKDDIGDLVGVPHFCIQVANRANITQALREKPLACDLQQFNMGAPFGATILKLPPQPGGKPAEWRVVQTLDQFADVVLALDGRAPEHVVAAGWASLDRGGAGGTEIAPAAPEATENPSLSPFLDDYPESARASVAFQRDT